MNLIVFSVFCLLLLWAAYAIFRTRYRQLSCRDLVAHLKPLSDHAQSVIALNTQGHIPETWLEFTDLYRATHNLTWFTMISDQFVRAIDTCSDEYSVANMRLVHETFMRKRFTLIKALLMGAGCLCCGIFGKRRFCVRMATIARQYTDELLLACEMVEIMDPHCAALLEGKLLHGS